MNWFEHLVNGNLAAARMVKNGVQKGDTVIINTRTAPTPSGFCQIKTRVTEVYAKGEFRTEGGDPYFNYTRFNLTDIIG